MFAFWRGVLRLRTDSFVDKRDEIQALKSMGKFITASTMTYLTLGVLQLISMAAWSGLWFTLFPFHSSYNPLAKRLLLLNSWVHYPYYNSKNRYYTFQVRMHASVQKSSFLYYLIPYAWKGSSLWYWLPFFSDVSFFTSHFSLTHLITTLNKSVRFR